LALYVDSIKINQRRLQVINLCLSIFVCFSVSVVVGFFLVGDFIYSFLSNIVFANSFIFFVLVKIIQVQREITFKAIPDGLKYKDFKGEHLPELFAMAC